MFVDSIVITIILQGWDRSLMYQQLTVISDMSVNGWVRASLV